MSVQAMFYVKAINQHHNPGSSEPVVEVKLAAAFGGYLKGLPEGEANADWSRYTPQGEVAMTITNPAASDQFELGGVYRLTFDKVA